MSAELLKSTARPTALVAGEAHLPTEHGDFRIVGFWNDADGREHVALVKGDVRDAHDVPVRLHSECLTGDAFGSLRCDCRAQLQKALGCLSESDVGILLYMRQEGRGIGLTNKVRAYSLQDSGLDTVDANLALGFRDDERRYGVAAAMLRALGVESIRLMTNNPRKVDGLRVHGIEVTERIPHQLPPTGHNVHYLATKVERSGHLLDLQVPESPELRAG